MSNKKIVKLFAGLFFSFVFLWLIAEKVKTSDFTEAFLGIRWRFLLLAGLSLLVGYAFRIERWRVMLTKENPQLKWQNCAGPFLASFAANNVLPFRAGDALRAFAFNKQWGVHSGTTLASLLVERLLDLLMILFFLGVTTALMGSDLSHLIALGSFSLIGVSFLIVVLLFFPGLFDSLVRWLGILALKLHTSLGSKIQIELFRAFEILKTFSKFSVMSRLLSFSVIVWIFEGGVFYFSALALPSLLSPNAAWLALPVGTLATLFPSTPGYIGTFDYFIMQTMTLLGNSSASGTAYALLVHACLWVPVTFFGGMYLLLRPAWQFYGKWRNL